MRRIVQKIKSLFIETKVDHPISSSKLDKFKKEAITGMDSDDNFLDRHIYWRMDLSEKKNPKFVPLKSFPKKDVYNCLCWQLHPYDRQKLSEYIDNNARLSRVENKSLLLSAAEADILIITSGSGKYHINSFLADLDTSEKIIIIASVRELDSIKQDITHRIDGHFNKVKAFSQADFNSLIDDVIKKAAAPSINEELSLERNY